MDKEFFEDVMKRPSVSRHEDMMIDFLMEWGPKHGCKTRKDAKGNVYMEKGSGIRPTLLNHIDTVHSDQEAMVREKKFKEIVWNGDHVTAKNPITERQTGLGMDNQGGACIALAVVDRLKAVKALFTVEEEIGMAGIRAADMSFFDDAAFVFSNDSPGGNRAARSCSGVKLYSDDFFEKYLRPICEKHGLTDFRPEPFTCIKRVRAEWHDKDGKHLECLNFGNGGDRPHSDQEGASFKDVNNAEALLYALCTEIPSDVQHVSELKEEEPPAWRSPYAGTPYGGGGSWGGYYGGSYGRSDAPYLPGFGPGGKSDLLRTGKYSSRYGKDGLDIPKPLSKDDWTSRSDPRKFKPDTKVSATFQFSDSARYEKFVTGKAADMPVEIQEEEDDKLVILTGKLKDVKEAWAVAFNVEEGTTYSDWKDFKSVEGDSGFYDEVYPWDEDNFTADDVSDIDFSDDPDQPDPGKEEPEDPLDDWWRRMTNR